MMSPPYAPRIIDHLQRPDVPADTAIRMCELLNVSRTHLQPELDRLCAEGELFPSVVGCLTVYRHHSRAGKRDGALSDPDLAVRILKAYSGNGAISPMTAWKAADTGGRSWGGAGRAFFGELELSGLLIGTQYGYTIAPLGRTHLKEAVWNES